MTSKYKYLISLLLMAVIIASCTSTPTGRKQLVLKSDAALAQEGARQMSIIRENSPLVQDRATIDYVACVADAYFGYLRQCHEFARKRFEQRTSSIEQATVPTPSTAPAPEQEKPGR